MSFCILTFIETGFSGRMNVNPHRSFPPGVNDKLGTYVYRLIDPRDGQTFYVGKGKGNRVFEHAKAEVRRRDDEVEGTLARIRDIISTGFDVAHVIHRHGLDDETARHVEAALIDAYPGLTNKVAGTGSNELGVMHAGQVIRLYEAEEAVFEHKVMLINVNRTATEQELYEATRYAWKVDPKRAARAEVILAVKHGLIIGVFVAEQWLEATSENFPGREPSVGRYGFIGIPASDEIRNKYKNKSIPDRFRKRGAANPIKYSYR